MTLRLGKALLILIFIISEAGAQRVELLSEKPGYSFRGLSVVSDKIVWVSGNKGCVGKTTDGGLHWQWMTIPGHDSTEFRDIEAFDAANAVVMAVGEPAFLLRTSDGGKTWKEVYRNNRPGMFLDAMDFRNALTGVVVGDPVGGRFFIAKTVDGGYSWKELDAHERPRAEEGEACFAASGTNIRFLGRDDFCLVSGGMVSRLFLKNNTIRLLIAQGKQSTGANSVAVWDGGASFAVVGGDFMADSVKPGNCLISRDGGRTWIRPSNPPNGYRSCVEYITGKKLVTCGLNGVDISFDEGINWNSISAVGFHVCRKARRGDVVFLAGGSGRIGRLIW